MRYALGLFFVFVGFIGCAKAKPEEPAKASTVDNTMTRYVDNLHADVDKARDAVDKYQKAVNQRQKDLSPSEP